jgi:uncharacterized protein YndB with AHSA1/START domain
MTSDFDREIFSSRILRAPVEIVYEAFANPMHLKKWWVPEGFTNTIHEFDLRPGGKWVLTMHGPEKGNYENESEFKIVEPLRQVVWQRISKPIFEMEISFEPSGDFTTRISFRMVFETVEECEKIRKFAQPKNEENFDRLEKEILSLLV